MKNVELYLLLHSIHWHDNTRERKFFELQTTIACNLPSDLQGYLRTFYTASPHYLLMILAFILYKRRFQPSEEIDASDRDRRLFYSSRQGNRSFLTHADDRIQELCCRLLKITDQPVLLIHIDAQEKLYNSIGWIPVFSALNVSLEKNVIHLY